MPDINFEDENKIRLGATTSEWEERLNNNFETIESVVNEKVDKVIGYGLSKNDYDDIEKANVASNTAVRHSHTNKTILDNISVYGKSLEMLYDALTGIVTTNLKDQDGVLLSTSQVDLPLELLIKSGSVKTCTEDNVPISGYVVGDKYIDLVLANDSHLYILVSDLIDQIEIIDTGGGNAVTSISIIGTLMTVTKDKTFVETSLTINGKALNANIVLSQDDIGNGETYVQTENNLSDTLKSNYDTAYTNTHTHSNKLLLDAYTQSETDLASAVSLKHSHSNKTVLDNTTASYTTDEQTKLLGIAGGAQVNVIEEIKVNNTALTPTLKSVNITIPVQASDVNALPDTTKYGATIDLSYTANTGVLGLVLKDQDGTQISSDSVDLPLELLIESGSVKTCTVIDTPVAGYVVGDKYIDLVLANSNHIYIKVSDLIDQITITETGTGNAVTDISISGNTITETKGKTFIETNRTVNGHALSSDITITKSDVGLGNAYNPTAYGGISYGGGASEAGISFTDLDILAYTGFYTCFGTTAHVPSSSYSWFIEHINSNVGNVSATQIAIAYATTTIIYIRHKISSTWGAWENISPSLKVDKTTTGSIRRVYGVNASNEQELTEIKDIAIESSSALITSGGVYTILGDIETLLAEV